ncbi:aspartate dehydrogenase:Homoserine dehydrogenase, NAD-binding [Rhodobacteraceae bacterium KLH11]|nr:aspartate dehydrogenase:Homoserine dehydrogenase, NAD-binding [Rhodobacteraceae bacterium KLH11]
MKIGLIGKGAITRHVAKAIEARGHQVNAVLVRPGCVSQNPGLFVETVHDLVTGADVVIDCAGHRALAEFGPQVLTRGTDVITVSIGALADRQVADALEAAARKGSAKLYLASGAIGALDCLAAAATGKLDKVTYVGRKPPRGWVGSAAEDALNLETLSVAATHFRGTAREAALTYPKNANVAAAVALAGVGFDETQVQLVADPSVTSNIHEIEAEGDFGQFHFRISGNSLPDNPRSSALAAMSVVAKIDQLAEPIVL